MGCWRQWGAGGSLHALGPQPRGAESLCRPHSRSQLKVHWAWWDSSRAGAGGGLRGALPAMLARELEAGCARAVCSPRLEPPPTAKPAPRAAAHLGQSEAQGAAPVSSPPNMAVEGKTEKPRGCADCGSCADRSAGEIYSDCLRGLCLRLWAVDLFSLRAWGWRRRRCCWASENTIGLAAAGLLAPRGG